MGATASFADRLDKKTCSASMGKEFDEAYFDNNAGEDGCISKDQLLAYFLQREKLRVAFDRKKENYQRRTPLGSPRFLPI